MALKYRDSALWLESHKLAKGILMLFENVVWSSGNQIRRAAVSVPNNIAEGLGRSSDLDTNRFFSYSRGSLFEVDYLAFLAAELGVISVEKQKKIETQCEKIVTMIDEDMGVVDVSSDDVDLPF